MGQQIIHCNQNTTKLINQLKAASIQYKPLNKFEEHDLIERFRANREQLNQLLFMHNIRLVFNIAKKYVTKTDDFDNLVQEGMKGLAIAATRFDIDRDIKFVTYAGFWIKKYIYAVFDERRNRIDKNSISLNASSVQLQTASSGKNDVTLENFVNDFIEPTQDKCTDIHSELSSHEQQNICRMLIDQLNNDSSLSAAEKSAFIDYFYNKEKTKSIASKYNLDVQKIFQIKSSILSKFKSTLMNQYAITSYNDI